MVWLRVGDQGREEARCRLIRHLGLRLWFLTGQGRCGCLLYIGSSSKTIGIGGSDDALILDGRAKQSGDEEGDLIENVVAMEATIETPYLKALQRGLVLTEGSFTCKTYRSCNLGPSFWSTCCGSFYSRRCSRPSEYSLFGSLSVVVYDRFTH
ncbi:hypothetical protein Dimus_018780 [Dionaea muscipula]